jgi:hypothetical protein
MTGLLFQRAENDIVKTLLFNFIIAILIIRIRMHHDHHPSIQIHALVSNVDLSNLLAT